MFGFKVFGSMIPNPDKTRVKTSRHPVQSFVWDDFTAKPDRIHLLSSTRSGARPRTSTARAAPVAITIRTEPLFSSQEHDVFFNRGVASSQAYTRSSATSSRTS